MHWSKSIVEECLKRGGGKTVIETGTSISGIPHIGNASDLIRGECVRKALEREGHDAELIWIADDSDPFRSIPKGMENMSEYLGYPVKDIPDPHRCHESFVDHYVEPFLAGLVEFGVNPKRYSATMIYRDGLLAEEIRTALSKRKEIIDILNNFRDSPLPQDYIPWTPICSECGKISTTKALKVKGDKVSYRCETQKVKGGEVEGCGYEGESDINEGNGKLPWRVEWAARWNRFNVGCEPFGKDHASAGGSYWSSKIISEKIFSHPGPVPVIYEFLTLNGDKISSSKGNVITPAGWLEIAEPEVLNYFMYKKLNKQRDIDLPRLTSMVDEYDAAEEKYFANPQDPENDHYLLSQVGEPRKLNIPFTLCAVLAQVIPGEDHEEIIKRARGAGYKDFDEQRLVKRVALAGEWICRHGPEQLRFTLNTVEESSRQYNSLEEGQKNAFRKLVELLDNKWGGREFHKQIYETARENNLKPPMLFKAIYQTLIGRQRGPKAASFLLSLDKEYLKKIIQQ